MANEFYSKEILEFEQRYRATFINSLGGFKSLCLVGTKSKEGLTNLAPFSSFFHIGANPPLFGLIFRPDSVERHTLNNILTTGEFTLNHVTESFVVAAHQTSARYPADVSEFTAVGLSEEYAKGIYPPFVKESFIKIGASFKERIDIKLNGTIMILAAINYVSVPHWCIGADGFVDLEKAGTVTSSGLDSYHLTNTIGRLSYAKPDVVPTFLD